MEHYGENFELTVSEFLEGLNLSLRKFRVTVSGELTGRINRRGAVTYFSIHDLKEEAVLQCMAFNSGLDKLGVDLAEGMAIKVSGNPEVWKRTGSFTFKVFEVLLTGEGALKQQFDALLKRLEGDGLFSPEYKKPLPRFISTIGLITAADREAHMDFITHLAKRGLSVHLHDVRVEGAQSVEQIVKAIQWFNEQMPQIEVLVLTRGGGSLESLQAFNSEAVARAIFASRIPIISAIGHEKDITVADFVADVRASTPTHAGKIISQDWDQADVILDGFAQKINSDIKTIVVESYNRLDQWRATAIRALEYRIATLVAAIKGFENKLTLSSPELRLKQGYSIVRTADGVLVRSTRQASVGAILETQLYEGKIQSKVTKNLR